MKIKGHTLGAWFNHLLFRLLLPKWYLRTQGIKLYSEPSATATITYELHGETKMTQVKFGSAMALVKMLPLWLKNGFLERGSEGKDRYAIPPHDILKIAWYDPVLKDYFKISGHDGQRTDCELTDSDLIHEHTWRWNAWLERRRDFGELGAMGDPRMVELEMEARRRGISDDQLLAPTKRNSCSYGR